MVTHSAMPDGSDSQKSAFRVLNDLGPCEEEARVPPRRDLSSAGANQDTCSVSDDGAFPMHLMPERCQGYLTELLRVQDCRSLAPLAMLATASAAIGKALKMPLAGGKSAKANLYIIIGAPSSGGKSETFREVTRPLVEIERRLAKVYRKEARPKVVARLKMLDSNEESLRKNEFAPEDEVQEELTRNESEKAQYEAQLVEPRVIVEDTTIEALQRLMAASDSALFSVTTETQRIFNEVAKGGYAKDGPRDAFLNKAYSHESTWIDRSDRREEITEPCLVILWSTQPGKLRGLLGNQTLARDGFLSRCLIVDEYEVKAYRMRLDATGISDEAYSQWAGLLAELFRLRALASDFEGPFEVRMAPDALEYYVARQNAVAERIDSGEFAGESAAGKFGENLGRVALVLHAMAHGKDAADHECSLATAMAASTIMDWVFDRLKADHERSRSDDEKRLCESAIEYLQRQKGNKCTLRDLTRALSKKTEVVRRACEQSLAFVLTERRNLGAKSSIMVALRSYRRDEDDKLDELATD